MALDIVFMGTPEFSVPVLDALCAAGHRFVAVYSQPPRPAGRGMSEIKSPVQRRAEALGLPVLTPLNFKGDAERADFAALKADAAVVVAYGLLLPKAVIEATRLGCYNVHASKLPRWRGAAPIHRAIEAGDLDTGVTIMEMEEGLDTGAMLLAERVAIGAAETTGALHDRLARLGADLIVAALRLREQGKLTPVPQPEAGVTYAAKISKEEAKLDFSRSAQELGRKIRAFNPFPGAHAEVNGVTIKIWGAEALAAGSDALVGQVLAADAQHGIVVACKSGTLRLTELQKPGGKRLPAAEFLKGFPLAGLSFD